MQLEIVEDNIYTFILPVYVDFPISPRARSEKNLKRLAAGKPYNRKWLNLNWYRNAHHHELSDAKLLFQPLEIPTHFTADKIKVSYSAERISCIKYDVMNVLSIVDKFFLDWLVIGNYIQDDNLNIVSYGSFEADNGNFSDRVIANVEILL